MADITHLIQLGNEAMPRCAHCNKTILFGGKKQGAIRFCDDQCYEAGFVARVAEEVAPDIIAERLAEIQSQGCPVCGGEGPVDISKSHTAWSIIVMTSWNEHPRLSCSRCGKKAIWQGIVTTSLFGWWGFPFGLVVTPWQIMNGFKSLAGLPHSAEPSEELQHLVRMSVADQMQFADADS